MIKIHLIKTCNKSSLFLTHPLLQPLYQRAQGPAPSVTESQEFSAWNWFQVSPSTGTVTTCECIFIFHVFNDISYVLQLTFIYFSLVFIHFYDLFSFWWYSQRHK